MAYPAIKTYILPPTNTRPARIVARCSLLRARVVKSIPGSTAITEEMLGQVAEELRASLKLEPTRLIPCALASYRPWIIWAPDPASVPRANQERRP